MLPALRKTHPSGTPAWRRAEAVRGKGARPLGIVLALVVTVGIAIASTMIGTAFPSQPSKGVSKPCCSAANAGPGTVPQDQSVTATQQASAPNSDPPGTIDGAKNPELIPDNVAYRVLFLAVAEPENPTKDQLVRAHAKVQRAELSEQDTLFFLTVASQFRKQIDDLAAQAAQISKGIAFVHPDSVQGRQLKELGKQQDQAFVDAMTKVKTGLSVPGSEKLYAHVQGIKRKMKLYPPPPNMPAF